MQVANCYTRAGACGSMSKLQGQPCESAPLRDAWGPWVSQAIFPLYEWAEHSGASSVSKAKPAVYMYMLIVICWTSCTFADF